MSINRTILVGRLVKSPELKKTGNGTSVTSFTLAVNRAFQAQGQEKQADFIQCICWNRVAENTAQYTKKGSLLGVEGRIQTRNYQNQQGQTVYVTEVVADSVQFLETKSQSNSMNTNTQAFQPVNDFSPASFETAAPQQVEPDYSKASQQYTQQPLDMGNSPMPRIDIDNDDLPF